MRNSLFSIHNSPFRGRLDQLGDDLQLSDAARADVYAALNDVDDETLLQSFLEELEELEVNRTRP